MSSASACHPGEQLSDRYRIVRLLGAGGMGAVYEAEHTLIGRRVAVKLIRPELAQDASMVGRFRRDAKAAGQLESDHIAAVTDLGQTARGELFIVMELLQGETLADCLTREPVMSPLRAAGLAMQACRGAQRAHDAGVVHCDLKPRNWFIVRKEDRTEQIKLLDFGIARLCQGWERSAAIDAQRVLGASSYLSPEQASGEGIVDARTDVYALGVVLYQMLSGCLPHPGHDPMAVRCRIVCDPPVPLEAVRPGLPSELVDIVHRAIAPRPNDRIQSAREMASLLAAFSAVAQSRSAGTGEPFEGVDPTLPEPPSSERPGSLRDHSPWVSQAGSSAPTGSASSVATAAPVERSARARTLIGGAAVLIALGLIGAASRWFGAPNEPRTTRIPTSDGTVAQPPAVGAEPQPSARAIVCVPAPSISITRDVPSRVDAGTSGSRRQRVSSRRSEAAVPSAMLERSSPIAESPGIGHKRAPRVRLDPDSPYR